MEEKELLVVVDYQNDFINGSLGFKGADTIADNIINHIKDFKSKGNEVVFTVDAHSPKYLETTEGKKLPIIHCNKGSEGYEIFYKVKEYSNNCKIFEKDSFGSLELANYIKDNNFTKVFLCGLVGDICVFFNAIMVKGSIMNTGEVYVFEDACLSPDLNHQKEAFKLLSYLHINIL